MWLYDQVDETHEYICMQIYVCVPINTHLNFTLFMRNTMEYHTFNIYTSGDRPNFGGALCWVMQRDG